MALQRLLEAHKSLLNYQPPTESELVKNVDIRGQATREFKCRIAEFAIALAEEKPKLLQALENRISKVMAASRPNSPVVKAAKAFCNLLDRTLPDDRYFEFWRGFEYATRAPDPDLDKRTNRMRIESGEWGTLTIPSGYFRRFVRPLGHSWGELLCDEIRECSVERRHDRILSSWHSRMLQNKQWLRILKTAYSEAEKLQWLEQEQCFKGSAIILAYARRNTPKTFDTSLCIDIFLGIGPFSLNPLSLEIKSAISGIEFGTRKTAMSSRSQEGTIAGARDVEHSDDFMWVKWCGTEYTFTRPQAPRVKVLLEAWNKGTPAVSKETLISCGPRTGYSGIADLFKGNPAWGTMIVKVKGRQGLYQLQRPPARR